MKLLDLHYEYKTVFYFRTYNHVMYLIPFEATRSQVCAVSIQAHHYPFAAEAKESNTTFIPPERQKSS